MTDVAGLALLGISIALFAVKVLAISDCIGRSQRDFQSADTLPKNGWLVILGLALAVHLVNWSPLSILNLAGTVAALVYLAQLRGSRY